MKTVILLFEGDNSFEVVLDESSKLHKQKLIEKLGEEYDMSKFFTLKDLDILIKSGKFSFDVKDENNQVVNSFECTKRDCTFNMFENPKVNEKKSNQDKSCNFVMKKGNKCTNPPKDGNFCGIHSKGEKKEESCNFVMKNGNKCSRPQKVDEFCTQHSKDDKKESVESLFVDFIKYMQSNRKVPKHDNKNLWDFGCKLVRSLNGLDRGLNKKNLASLDDFKTQINKTIENDKTLKEEWDYFLTFQGSRKCTKCDNNASFNYEKWSSWGARCGDHKDKDMVNVMSKKK